MKTLHTLNGENIDTKINFSTYKNIVGSSDDKDNKFDSFMSSLLNDDPISVIQFYKALAGNALSEDQVVEQLEEQSVFDDIEKEVDELISDFKESGFFLSQIKRWLKSGEVMTKQFKKTLKKWSQEEKEKSEGKEEVEMPEELIQSEIQVEIAQEQLKSIKKRLNLKED